MSTSSHNVRIYEDQLDSEAEVELISLITESLPHYKLREDYSVRFSGYQHCDFTQAEQVKEEITELSNDQIHQTLEYFILCGLRVSKMTETYEDCAALTMLVQEQRSHLDLAANIGLNLVEKNTQLEQRVQCLEEQLEASRETNKQVSHQLSLKDDLLRMFHGEIEDSEDQNCSQAEATDCEFQLDRVNVRQLENKFNRLEEENIKLREKQHTIANNTDLLENKEAQLINDCVSHILESTKTIDRLSVELNKKTNDYLNQHEEISRLLTTKIDLENKTHNLLSENDFLITQLRDYQTKEFTLTKEVSDMRDRYDECINLLNEKQDEIRQLKKLLKKETKKRAQYYNCSPSEPDLGRSLAEELEESSKRGMEEMDHSRTIRIMEQARCLNSTWNNIDDETSSGFTEDFSSSVTNIDTEAMLSDQLSGNFLLRRRIQDDCKRRRLLRHTGDIDDKDDYLSASGTITPYSQPNLSDSQYVSEALYHHQNSCNGFSSLNSSIISRNESSNSLLGLYRYPDKLQLIKPIEGSQTLRAWQNLATPSLTKALFEDQPSGVCYRGQQLSSTSSLSSPNSNTSQDGNDQGSHIPRNHVDIDHEVSPPILSAHNLESHSNTCTYSSSRMPYTRRDMTCSTMKAMPGSISSVIRRDNISSLTNTNTGDIPRGTEPSFCPSNDHENTLPVSALSTNSHQSLAITTTASSSWLDRFTVGSIMNGMLSFSRPLSSACSYSPVASTLSTISNSLSETGLIGRLTHVPALAKCKPPQPVQSGLNLLTSFSPSTITKTAIYRSYNPENIDDQSNDPLGQVD